MGHSLKVLQVGKFYPPHRGGIESHLQVLCEGLKKHVDLEVLVANDARLTRYEIVRGVGITRLGTAMTAKGTSFCPELVRRIANSRADVVHIHLPNPAAVLAYLASGHRGPVIASYHSDIVRQKLLALVLSPLTQRFLSKCRAIVLASPNYLATSQPVSMHLEKCHVIPYGIALEDFLSPDWAAVEKVRRQYGERLILSVGRLVYYKGFEYLIDAMTAVDGSLLIVGQGPLKSKLQERAARAGVADKVFFLGSLDDRELRACYHAADVFVLASTMRSEAFGIVQIEAMASGVPVINTQIDSGVPFVSINEQTGFTVPPGDPESLTSSINQMLNSQELRISLGRAARQRAQQVFSAEDMITRTMNLYASVANRVQPVSAAVASA